MSHKTCLRLVAPSVAACLLVGLSCALYLPFLKNPLVFDDEAFFFTIPFAYYATTPIGLNLRVPAYFTLAFTQMTWGSFPVWHDLSAHRIVSLCFHSATVLALFKWLYDLLRAVMSRAAAGDAVSPGVPAHRDALLPALAGAAIFAIHPVAVYGAGYLVQRSIVMATLFSLLSMILFLRGLTRGSHADALSAALFYSLAVLSKEHSLMLPAAAVLMAALAGEGRRFATRHVAIYLVSCIPAAMLVVFLAKGYIGTAYEPYIDDIVLQLESVFGLDKSQLTLWSSAAIQAGQFFRYLGLWLWPQTSGMAIDIRVDFVRQLSDISLWFNGLAFAAAGAAGLALLRRKGLSGLAGFGLLYAWTLFIPEFSVLRFQEPFVLYRSYLWAPGILLALVALMAAMPRKVVAVAVILALPVLFYQARDRLWTFSNEVRLWEDAAAKLPQSEPVPWGSRTLFNLGRAYLIEKRVQQASAAADRCLAQYPGTFQCYYARAGVHAAQREFEAAIYYFERALEVAPAKKGVLYHHIGMALEELGRMDEAKSHYIIAAGLGFEGGDYQLRRLGIAGYGTGRSSASGHTAK